MTKLINRNFGREGRFCPSGGRNRGRGEYERDEYLGHQFHGWRWWDRRAWLAGYWREKTEAVLETPYPLRRSVEGRWTGPKQSVYFVKASAGRDWKLALVRRRGNADCNDGT